MKTVQPGMVRHFSDLTRSHVLPQRGTWVLGLGMGASIPHLVGNDFPTHKRRQILYTGLKKIAHRERQRNQKWEANQQEHKTNHKKHCCSLHQIISLVLGSERHLARTLTSARRGPTDSAKGFLRALDEYHSCQNPKVQNEDECSARTFENLGKFSKVLVDECSTNVRRGPTRRPPFKKI